MDEQEIITKKIEELRKYIPAIESKIKIIQGNPVFQTQLDKFLYMRKTIISGRFVSNNGSFINKQQLSSIFYFTLLGHH